MPTYSIVLLLAFCALLVGAQAKAPLTPRPAVPSSPAMSGREAGGGGRPQANSLCRADEQVLFSCRVGDGPKLASVCGSRRLDAKQGYVQYRFGRAGALELEFPQEREGTQGAFRYAHYFRARVDRTELSFERGGYRYALYHYYEGDVRPAAEEAGVRVSRPGGAGEATEIRCRGRAINRLGILSSVVPNDEDSELGPGG